MPKLNIVKIGGAVIEEEVKLLPFLKDFAALKGPKILVHGGGKKATAWSEKLGIPVQMRDGRRITDAATLELITGLYAGQVNKNIVAHLQGMNCNALGFSGADANAIQAVKRPVKAIDYGFVGDVKKVNNAWFQYLLDQNISPVCCAITHDKKGQLFNTNADTITAEIGKALAQDFEVKICYCFELSGVMKDLNDPNSLIENINRESYQELLLNNTIAAGMLPKLHNAFDALSVGVNEVAIGPTNMINKNIPYTSITL
jgi:acetylglutamate kinase